MFSTFYALTLLLLGLGVALLALRMREGWVALGLGIASCGFFVTHVISYGFVVLGVLTIPLGLWLWRKD